MAYTKDDFLDALRAEASKYPTVARSYQAGDPQLLAQMSAVATMLAMISSQIDVESMEPFNKVRDTTVMADAAMRGILPFARPSRLTLAVANKSSVPLVIAAGRRILGPDGHVYLAETPVTVAATGAGTVNVKQMTTRTIQHTVDVSAPFYSVQVQASADSDQKISGVLVSIAGVNYPYVPEFANVAVGDPAFTLETDEQRRLFVVFGWDMTFGIQPPNGTVIELTVEETAGELSVPAGAAFTFETSDAVADQDATLVLATTVFPGAAPIDIDTLRDLCTYPTIYSQNAVYLGNFDFNIRQALPGLRFLSVWNEQIEEAARGPNIKSINALFFAILYDGVDDAWLAQQVVKVIAAADDSYRAQRVAAVPVELPLTIDAEVAMVHDPATVKSQIIARVLALYGRDAAAAKHGLLQINRKKIYGDLKENVLALQDDGSDFSVTLGATTGKVLPEHYRYVSEASLVVNVKVATYNNGMWSH